MKNEKIISGLLLVAACLTFAGCRNVSTSSEQNTLLPPANNSPANTRENPETNAAKAVPSETHEHLAPHGGTLIAFGEEFAHLELVLDPASGQLTAYALDGEAEKSVALAQEEIEIRLEKPKKITVKLAARENALTGEKKGATSEFRAAADELRNLREFDAVVKAITIRGREFKDTHFNFPKGNEDTHAH